MEPSLQAYRGPAVSERSREGLKRIFSRCVRVESGCFEWTGYRMRKGVGQIRFEGRARLVPRVVWQLSRGPIPDGMLVCHRCDNPPCVEIDHLFLGTSKDNSQDMVRKGRAPSIRGEKSVLAKCSEEQIREIKNLAQKGVLLKEIAIMYGYHRAHVSRIVNGKRWAHVKSSGSKES